MASHEGTKVVYGASHFSELESAQKILDAIYEEGVRNVDTAQLYGYGTSETVLGEAGAHKRFVIDTKAYGGFNPGTATEEAVFEEGEKSVKKLQTDKVDIFYIHAPDPSIPIESTLAGIDRLYKAGRFERLGLSNFTAEGVKQVHALCKAKGYVLPTVYQGNYSPVARRQETELFPTLAELGMAFYAYSPLAGGFLTKTKQQVLDGAGRFDPSNPPGAMYSKLYNRPAYLEVLAQWEDIAQQAGATRAELAYRWVAFHSPLRKEKGDAVIFGARNIDQARETIQCFKRGPLGEAVAKRIDDIWKSIEHEAPLDNYNSYWVKQS